MKVFFVILVLTVAALADHHEGHDHHDHDHHVHHESHDYVVKHHDDLVKFRDECSTKLKISPELMEKYKSWEYPDDEATHCYMKCIFEHFGFFDEHKGFDVHKIHHQLVGEHVTVDHNDETHHKIEHCADKNTQGSDACTWAYRGGMCFIRSNLQLVKGSVHKH
uniref:Odorant binding protein n=1 Tax=Calliphora stygia TaxID=145453 RepID=A0A068F5Q4_CALSG|nr:odorant binding protein [Calliphora stygia]